VDDWEHLDPPTMFMDSVVTIKVSDKLVTLQEMDFFSETLQAPLEFVQNELDSFEDAFEDVFYDPVLLPEESLQMELFQPDFLSTHLNTLCVESDNDSLT